MTNEADDFGPVQMIGCVGMLGCATAAFGLLIAAGGYTLATGEALRLPMLEIGLGWFGALGVFEVMAFGWLIVRLMCVAVVGALIGVGTVAVLGL